MKKFLSIVFIFILSLGLILVRPFDIYADSISVNSDVVGINLYNVNIMSGASSCTFELILNKSVRGTITYNIKYASGTFSQTRTVVFVIDGKKTYSSAEFGVMPVERSNFTFTYSSSNIQYIDDNRELNFPLESLSVIKYAETYFPYEQFMNIGNYYLPTFTLTSSNVGDYVFKDVSTKIEMERYYVFGINRNIYNAQSLQTWLTFENVDTIQDSDVGVLFRFDQPSAFSIIKVRLHKPVTTTNYAIGIKYNGTNNTVNYMPIYFNSVTNNKTEIDFALLFDLPNRYIDALAGTSESNESSSNLEDSSNDLSDVSDPMFTLEDSFNSDMNDALDDIDTSFSFENGFGSKFLSSANFVKNEFDFITQNTVFGSLLSFSLLLGLGLLIIGKIL